MTGGQNDSGAERLFTVKMRASLNGHHISGAERIVDPSRISRTFAALADRALRHPKGTPDFINLKAEVVGGALRIPALPVETVEVADFAEGWKIAGDMLREAGVVRADEICARFRETYGLRGAMLLDADTLERLDDTGDRGVRATNMDSDQPPPAGTKNHFAEALTLASKVLSAPGIVAEVCVSDDPDYVTGYVATHKAGYRRITKLKELGDEAGGRIFLYRGRREDVAATIDYLEHRAVIVEAAETANDTAQNRLKSLECEMADIEAAGLKREIRMVEKRPGAKVCVGGRELVSFASNDYLGLAGDARVAKAAAEAAMRFGAGSGASRLVEGTLSPHVELEKKIAAFKGGEDAIVFATGYMANAGAISAIVGRGDVVFSDELNHASIIDGCRLSGAEVEVYPHLDMEELERRLRRCRAYRRRLVVSDGVFSMDGDMLPLPQFIEVCRRHDAFSMVDEAHSIGVVGATGRGLCEHFGCGNPDLMMGTLSKSLGSAGGYVAGSKEVVAYLRQKSRTFMFSTAPVPSAMAGASAALSILEDEPWRVERLRKNVGLFVGALAEKGVCAETQSAIVPILIGDERKAVAVSDALREQGFLVPAIRYPTVARSAARLRAAIRSDHSESDLLTAAKSIAAAM